MAGVTAVDWSAYQKCPLCPALLGKPCVKFNGYVAELGRGVKVEEDGPHSTRPLRAEAARAGGGRG